MTQEVVGTMHSSVNELKELLSFLRPKDIYPCVVEPADFLSVSNHLKKLLKDEVSPSQVSSESATPRISSIKKTLAAPFLPMTKRSNSVNSSKQAVGPNKAQRINYLNDDDDCPIVGMTGSSDDKRNPPVSPRKKRKISIHSTRQLNQISMSKSKTVENQSCILTDGIIILE